MTRLAQLIAQEEGFFRSGTLPRLRNNPGDLRHSQHGTHPGGPGHANDIATIGTEADGWADLERQLQIDAARGLTLREAIYEWAPAGDGNQPSRYLADVVLGFDGAVTADMALSAVLKISAA